MKIRKVSAVLLVTAFSTGLAGFTISQTTARELPGRDQEHMHSLEWHSVGDFAEYNPAEVDEMARFQLIGDEAKRSQFYLDWENMTPQQRDQMFRKFGEDRLRDSLMRHGFVQDELQDAVIEFSRLVENDRRNIRDKSSRLREGMAIKANDAQIAALLADLRRSVAYARVRRDRGRKVLNAKIGFSKKPRLDAVLSLSGLGGDESAYLMSSFGGGPFGRRGFGGHGKR